MRIERLVEMADCDRAAELLQAVWRTDQPMMTPQVLRALSWSGGYVFGAWDPAGGLVGVSVAFLTPGPGLHSHITGVVPGVRGSGLGVALKEHQRAWALERGIAEVGWTCDPLVRRNMSFNLRRLGARVEAYVPDFYGPMADGLNSGDRTDRLHVVWPLAAPAPREPDVAGAVPVVSSVDGTPVVADPGSAGRLLVATPADVESLRCSDKSLAQRWRAAVRDALLPRLEQGWRITGLTGSGDYVLEAP